MNDKKLFKRFMKNSGLWKAYQEAFQNDKYIKNESLNLFLKKNKPDDYILDGFDWYHSNDKHEFWDNVNNAWRQQLELSK